jgi:hypothetical protein
MGEQQIDRPVHVKVASQWDWTDSWEKWLSQAGKGNNQCKSTVPSSGIQHWTLAEVKKPEDGVSLLDHARKGCVFIKVGGPQISSANCDLRARTPQKFADLRLQNEPKNLRICNLRTRKKICVLNFGTYKQKKCLVMTSSETGDVKRCIATLFNHKWF